SLPTENCHFQPRFRLRNPHSVAERSRRHTLDAGFSSKNRGIRNEVLKARLRLLDHVCLEVDSNPFSPDIYRDPLNLRTPYLLAERSRSHTLDTGYWMQDAGC